MLWATFEVNVLWIQTDLPKFEQRFLCTHGGRCFKKNSFEKERKEVFVKRRSEKKVKILFQKEFRPILRQFHFISLHPHKEYV